MSSEGGRTVLTTSTSTPPRVSSTTSTASLRAWPPRTSAGTATARPPAAVMRPHTSSSGSWRRPHTATEAPASASAQAIARPMPVPRRPRGRPDHRGVRLSPERSHARLSTAYTDVVTDPLDDPVSRDGGLRRPRSRMASWFVSPVAWQSRFAAPAPERSRCSGHTPTSMWSPDARHTLAGDLLR